MNKGVEKLLKTGKGLERFTYQWIPIYCKKKECRSCPHGPYLYAKYRDGKRIHSIYIGRFVPEELRPYVSAFRAYQSSKGVTNEKV